MSDWIIGAFQLADKFYRLLNRIREQQRHCPYCGGEYACHPDCILKDEWFKRYYQGAEPEEE
jgi:hypothetical protein